MARTDTMREVDSTSLFRAGVGVFAALVALIAVVVASEWLARADMLPVRAVRFEGEFRHVSQAELAAAVEPAVQGSFLQLDLDAIRARAESIAWVHQAEIRRRWPADLAIRVSEQQLVARWNDSAWVNHAMQAVRVPEMNDMPVDVPRLEGPEGTQAIVHERYHAFGRVLGLAGLKIQRLVLTPRRTWQIELGNGTRLLLDRTQPDTKLERFARVYDRVLARSGEGARVIDLRYTNGFTVAWPAGRASGRGETAGHTKSAARRGETNEEG